MDKHDPGFKVNQQIKNYIRFIHYLRRAGQIGIHYFDMKKISKWSDDAASLAASLNSELAGEIEKINFEFDIIKNIKYFPDLEAFCRTKLEASVIDRILEIEPPKLNDNREHRLRR